MFNPMAMQMLQMIRQGANPQQMLLQYLTQNQTNNPMIQNLLKLAQAGDGKQIETIARNYVESRGLSYDKEFDAFKQMLGR